jgi:hypothetical protein
MANPEHLELLGQGVDAWNDWRARKPSVCPDLSEAILRHADLARVSLSQANLAKVDLREAFLTGANLSGADLCCANLVGASRHRVLKPDVALAPLGSVALIASEAAAVMATRIMRMG